MPFSVDLLILAKNYLPDNQCLPKINYLYLSLIISKYTSVRLMSYLCIAFDMPLFGTYGEDFDEELRLYLERLLKPEASQKLPSGTEVVQVPHRGMCRLCTPLSKLFL